MLRAGGVPEEQVVRARLQPARRVNENPGRMSVAGLRHLMQQHAWTRDLDVQLRRRAREVSLRAAQRRGWFAEPFVGLDDDMAVAIAERFAGDNDTFAQAHWQRSWDDVFGADAGRRWVPNEIDPAAAPPDVIEELGAFADTFVAACKKRR
jgi:hypothetical protein